MKAYAIVRTVHLYSALVCVAPLALYFVSGVRMAHRTWMPAKPVVSRLTAPVDGDAVAVLAARGLIRGERRWMSHAGDVTRFRIERPGLAQDVTCKLASCEIVTTDTGVAGIQNTLHQTGGFGFGYAPYQAWGMIAALVSVSLLVMGVSGLYLWFVTHTKRLIGAVLLVIGVGFPLFLVLSMRY